MVYGGALAYLNGVDYLARVAAAVYRRNPEVRFLVVGGGSQEDVVRREAKRLGLLGYAENLEALSSAWMAGKALTGEQEETLDYLMSLETLTNDEKTYRAARRWLALNLTPAGLWRRLIVPREQLLSRCEEAKTKKEAIWRCLIRAKQTYRMYLGEFFVFRKRIPKKRRQALARAARRLYRGT